MHNFVKTNFAKSYVAATIICAKKPFEFSGLKAKQSSFKLYFVINNNFCSFTVLINV